MEANIEIQDLALQLHENNVIDDDDIFMLIDDPRPRRNLRSILSFWRCQILRSIGSSSLDTILLF